MYQRLKSLGKNTLMFLTRTYRLKKLTKMLSTGLPGEMRVPLQFLVTGKCDESTLAVMKNAENRRKEIAKGGETKVTIWYSPLPQNEDENISLEPGKKLQISMAHAANLGKPKKWGTLLYLVAREFASRTVVELGSCVCISGIYLSSPPNVKSFVTIEGSSELATIAKQSLSSYQNATVINDLFEKAIESEISFPKHIDDKVDLVYIDGHHEKIATIRYFDKLSSLLNPGGIVIFDDISWSYDMRDAWMELSQSLKFSHTIDLGVIGICILKTESQNQNTSPINWDLQPLIGKVGIGDPWGWKK